jgi:hypothetical protein
MTRTTRLLLTFVSISAFAVSACSSGDVPVGATDTSTQGLKKNKDGSKTGNGSTCSWDQSVSNTPTTGASPDSPTTNPSVGEAVSSPDTCNHCTCTAEGVVCTLLECAPVACPDIAKLCPDGSYVGATGPNCEFKCPGDTPVSCTTEAKACPDGSYVGRSGPNCDFAACPTAPPVGCTADAKQCPDGTYVSRTGPNCTFPACK